MPAATAERAGTTTAALTIIMSCAGPHSFFGRGAGRLLVLVLVLVTLAGGFVVYRKRGPSRPDPVACPRRGIDVSHHQGTIDWGRVAQSDVRFAFIKATEGGDYRDPRFSANWLEAAQAGLARGAYHFFTFRKRGAEQAANFIAVVPPDATALPPVIDFEFAGNSVQRFSDATLVAEVMVFARTVEQHYGQRPIFYVTQASYLRYLVGKLEGYPIWIRDTWGRPSLLGGDFVLWQYSDRGRVDGIKGDVDLDVFCGDNAAWRALTER